MKLKTISATEILDSRGNPTVKAYVTLEDGSVHSAAVPSGASTGKHEAIELRDADAQRYAGKGVKKACENVNTRINDVLKGREVSDLNSLDSAMIELDGTENKANLGANAILAVSLAAARSAAFSEGLPLWKFLNQYYYSGAEQRSPKFPGVFCNVINGGVHAGWNFDIQEFMLVVDKHSPSESVRVAAEIFHALGSYLKKGGYSTLVGDEGGYSPALSSNRGVFETIIEGAKSLPYKYGEDFKISIDAAASEFYQDGKYMLMKDKKEISPDELIAMYISLNDEFHLFSIEDPFDQDDWAHYAKFTGMVGDKTWIVGDDFFVTNPERIKRGVQEKSANAGLIKINQIGTLKETIEAIKLCQQANWGVVVSHRSGETEDAFIADLSYAVGADYIKTGSMSRSERLAKYNRLIEIEQREI